MRGDLVTIALQGDFGKPRPALVIQSNFFFDHPSVTILPITSEIRETPLFRFLIEPSQENGLLKNSQVMIDKIQTVSTEKVSKPFGSISEAQLLEVNRLLALFLGLA
jgi:mRNA interferase MazF